MRVSAVDECLLVVIGGVVKMFHVGCDRRQSLVDADGHLFQHIWGMVRADVYMEGCVISANVVSTSWMCVTLDLEKGDHTENPMTHPSM